MSSQRELRQLIEDNDQRTLSQARRFEREAEAITQNKKSRQSDHEE